MSLTASSKRILLVDDDAAFRLVMGGELSRRGHQVDLASDGRQALQKAQAADVDVVLLDLRLPDLDGIEVLKLLRARDAAAGVVVLTGHGTIDTAIQAIRLGAYDYLEKPCPIEKVEMAVRKMREHLSLIARQRVLQDGYSPPDVRSELVGSGPAIQKLRETVCRLARTNATTLILGETGVGKDLIAKLLHTESPRCEAPFVVVDCAALHEDLLQSELFGHEKGSFSGATRLKHGLFEVASGGTLFLDEVGDTSLDIQAKLLRVLESSRFRRVGGTQEIAVDVRIVSATNRDLRNAIAQGRFREDLYFRLSTLTVAVPPLRERREDIPLLVAHFTERFNRRLGRSCRVGAQAQKLLRDYDWPGNVRELLHVLEQAIVLCGNDEITPDLLPRLSLHMGQPTDGLAVGAPVSLRELERSHVLAVLDRVSGNRAQAARILGISERNLYRIIKRLAHADAVRE